MKSNKTLEPIEINNGKILMVFTKILKIYARMLMKLKIYTLLLNLIKSNTGLIFNFRQYVKVQ